MMDNLETITNPQVADSKWWALQNSNLRPLPCQGSETAGTSGGGGVTHSFEVDRNGPRQGNLHQPGDDGRCLNALMTGSVIGTPTPVASTERLNYYSPNSRRGSAFIVALLLGNERLMPGLDGGWKRNMSGVIGRRNRWLIH